MNALEAKLRSGAEQLAWVIASALLQFIETSRNLANRARISDYFEMKCNI